MRTKHVAYGLLAAVLSFGLAACGGGSGGGSAEESAEPTGDQIRVEINNDIVPGTTIVVWMTPETGSRRRLGSVPPNQRGSFTYRPTVRSLDHRLVADQAGGGSETSRAFSLVGVTGVRWNISDPAVSLIR